MVRSSRLIPEPDAVAFNADIILWFRFPGRVCVRVSRGSRHKAPRGNVSRLLGTSTRRPVY